MAKLGNISEIHPTLGLTEFDILEKYCKSFNESELGRLHFVFPFDSLAKEAGLWEQRLGRKNIFSPSAKIALMVLKSYTGFSDRQLVAHLNGNIHYQIFCGLMINAWLPIPYTPTTPTESSARNMGYPLPSCAREERQRTSS